MTWRRLVVLVSGLSPQSLWHHLHRTDSNGQPRARTIDDPDEAERTVKQLLR